MHLFKWEKLVVLEYRSKNLQLFKYPTFRQINASVKNLIVFAFSKAPLLLLLIEANNEKQNLSKLIYIFIVDVEISWRI